MGVRMSEVCVCVCAIVPRPSANCCVCSERGVVVACIARGVRSVYVVEDNKHT